MTAAPLDPTIRRVWSVVLAASNYARDYRPIDDEALAGPSCLSCRGDGCWACDFTGVRA